MYPWQIPVANDYLRGGTRGVLLGALIGLGAQYHYHWVEEGGLAIAILLSAASVTFIGDPKHATRGDNGSTGDSVG